MTPPPAQQATLGSRPSQAADTEKTSWLRLAATAGPGLLIAVGYMDPGNWATDLASGAQFGFTLLPVVVLSSLAALFLQMLSMKLGLVSGADLAQHCRAHYGRKTNTALWLSAQLAIVACDVAEIIGTAIALQLLFGLPVLMGMCATVAATFAVLSLQNRGMRRIQAFVVVLMGVVCACLLYELFLSRVPATGIFASFLPSKKLLNPNALYLSLGILGATIMPHNIYLHSTLARDQAQQRAKPQALRLAAIDCAASLFIAALVNAAILILAASALGGHGGHEVDFAGAYRLLAPSLGTGVASTVFAVALLAAGQNATITDTMAGQAVMAGFLGLNVSPVRWRWITRGIALFPALGAAAFAGEGSLTQLLVLSQVVLSLQLGFAIFPLVRFTNDRKIMGRYTNRPATKFFARATAFIIVGANVLLLVQTVLLSQSFH
ncbi:MAG TPA: Nramp family divalent metal transporter [Rhizomicrobium sp.]|nr:Nramp family divalent metal transporter [Rhizomicrobium sp.]